MSLRLEPTSVGAGANQALSVRLPTSATDGEADEARARSNMRAHDPKRFL